VLVLSKFAGAANELDTALIVNPHDIDGMARTIATALSMPLTERRMRWEAMMTKLRGQTIQQWFASFTDALHECQLDREALAPVIADTTIWPLRSATTPGGVRYH
jgi:trehalose 6-phosphate synthase